MLLGVWAIQRENRGKPLADNNNPASGNRWMQSKVM
jgi:hypothetical protein